MRATFLLTLLLISAACSRKSVSTASASGDGWTMLFDGTGTQHWRGAYATDFPSRGWVVRDGELRGELSEGAESGDAGDIVTRRTYREFELSFEWKLGANGNSGLKYFVEERLPKPERGSQAGYEYQLIDDAGYRYQGKPLPPDLKTASIYDVVAADKPDVPMGVWHRSRIVVRGTRIQHWLDDRKVLDVDRRSAAFRQGVADSKFNEYPGFAAIPEGHILLQDHGHSVAFRNIRIREFRPAH